MPHPAKKSCVRTHQIQIINTYPQHTSTKCTPPPNIEKNPPLPKQPLNACKKTNPPTPRKGTLFRNPLSHHTTSHRTYVDQLWQRLTAVHWFNLSLYLWLDKLDKLQVGVCRSITVRICECFNSRIRKFAELYAKKGNTEASDFRT